VTVYGLSTAAFMSADSFDAAGEAAAVYSAIIALTNSEIDAAISAASV
jgi:hypothetical protein